MQRAEGLFERIGLDKMARTPNHPIHPLPQVGVAD